MLILLAGTGKTFIGALFTRIILQCCPNVKILCLCYTNHALDSFLEYLVANGVKNGLVRVGGRSKSEVLSQYNLSQLVHKQADTLTTESKRLHYKLNQECQMLRDTIDLLQSEIKQFADNFNNDVNSFPWDVAVNLLDSVDISTDCFTLRNDDGFVFHNKAMRKNDFLWRSWLIGRSDATFLSILRSSAVLYDLKIWKMPMHERRMLVKNLAELYVGDQQDSLAEAFYKYSKSYNDLQEVKLESKRSVLRSARVIGATTSGATSSKELLESCGAQLVLVEEAGEVLEAHVITSLVESVEHLVLIGDHQQLRPKVECYDLQVVSERGYNMDKSLFERLVRNSGLQPAILSMQRRMRPEISHLIKHVYPDLQDHPCVREYPNLSGISRNMLFVDHNNGEVSRALGGYTNPFEVDMAVEIAGYLLKNGYKPRQLVILTPYLGQLQKIRRTINSTISGVEAMVSELDKMELIKKGVSDMDDDIDNELNDTEDNSQKKTLNVFDTDKRLRTATIDNFQGEEADVVIISLVRCNKNDQVGFLKEQERVTVLLSRAKHGMIILGSTDTLRNSKASSVWEPILLLLDESNSILKGIPSYCQRHPEDSVFLTKPKDFPMFRPNGGCQLQCTFRLANCGHACKQKCHSYDIDHELIQCLEPCARFPPNCLLEHKCPKLCYEKCGACTVVVQNYSLKCGHPKDLRCFEVGDQAIFKNIECNKDVAVVVPRCNHENTFKCYYITTTCESDWCCKNKCGATLECGHICQGECGTCFINGKHAKCVTPCDRKLLCGHRCEDKCHKECPPCRRKCFKQCAHSKCPKQCSQVCASCTEQCIWECEHRGQCAMPCGAPCTRLPCNLRCSKILECGHRCPTVCGEPCPSKQFCKECGDCGEQVVDLVMMDDYKSISLDEDPVCILPCGHIFTISTLDSHMELLQYYRKNEEDSIWIEVQPLANVQAGPPKDCPHCKAIISNVYRYGRAKQYTELLLLERKFALDCARLVKSYSNISDICTRATQLWKLREKIQKGGPTKLIYEAAGGNNQIQVPKPPPTSFLNCVIEFDNCLNSNTLSMEVIEDKFATAEDVLSSAVEVAQEGGYNRSLADIKILLVQFSRKKYPDYFKRVQAGLQQKMVSLLTDVIDFVGSVTEEQREKAKKILQLIQEVLTDEEILEIQRAIAMAEWGGHEYQMHWAGHWFECPNGHPYFIGECGGAMQATRCPECGATVGGGGHVLAAGNRQASAFINRTSQQQRR